MKTKLLKKIRKKYQYRISEGFNGYEAFVYITSRSSGGADRRTINSIIGSISVMLEGMLIGRKLRRKLEQKYERHYSQWPHVFNYNYSD